MLLTSVAIIISMTVYYLLRKSTGMVYLKKLLLPLACIVFVLLLIIFPKTAVSAALKGLKLWLEIVVPSLFPFFIASELLKKSGFIRSAGTLLEPVMKPLFNIPGTGSFAFLMGITSGYPVGAKITADLYDEKLLTRNEAERLLAFSNNSGPLFIIGAVSVGMYRFPVLGPVLLTCHIAAGITVGMIFGFLSGKSSRQSRGRSNVYHTEKFDIRGKSIFSKFKKELQNQKNSDPGSMLGSAVANSVQTILMIGGFIIFFSTMTGLLLETGVITSLSDFLAFFLSPFGINRDLLKAVLSGLFEITTGTSLACGLTNTPPVFKLMATSFILGWAGLSVHSQVLCIVSGKGLSMKPYFMGKLLQGCFAAVYTLIFYRFVFRLLPETKNLLTGIEAAFSQASRSVGLEWQGVLVFSLVILTVLLTFYFILSSADRSVKKR